MTFRDRAVASMAAKPQRRVIYGGQAGQGQGGEHEPEATQCDVVLRPPFVLTRRPRLAGASPTSRPEAGSSYLRVVEPKRRSRLDQGITCER
jgi:hypothetical protein